MKQFYKNKKILITGCTGFTGGWLILYLKFYGAKIYGYSLDPPFNNSLFEIYKLNKKIIYKKGNIKNFKDLKKFYKKANPDFVFHLAASPLVKECYNSPFQAFNTNANGTLNLMEVIRTSQFKKKISLNIITTDKVYENTESKKKFNEKDKLGGDDPYSSSKVCAEIICKTYYSSYFQNKNISMNILRSGNIIGGGDWSENRLLPDIMNSYFKNKKLILRNPSHVRPWQHIFDVINSYVRISLNGYLKRKTEFNAWNIGPTELKSFSVNKILELINKLLPKKIKSKVIKSLNIEKKILNLNSKKLFNKLGIKNKLNIFESINLTVKWYSNHFKKKDYNFSKKQLIEYLNNE